MNLPGCNLNRGATWNRRASGQSLIGENITMIRYKEIAFTAYSVLNMKKARKFYENFIEYDIGPGTLVVGCAPEHWQPSEKGTTAALEVVDLDAALQHLKKKRIKLAMGPMDFPVCRSVGVRDPDGNLIMLHQRKKPGKK
jgi:predicted enzyme related to lactoylglutathione lyase